MINEVPIPIAIFAAKPVNIVPVDIKAEADKALPPNAPIAAPELAEAAAALAAAAE